MPCLWDSCGHLSWAGVQDRKGKSRRKKRSKKTCRSLSPEGLLQCRVESRFRSRLQHSSGVCVCGGQECLPELGKRAASLVKQDSLCSLNSSLLSNVAKFITCAVKVTK